MAANTRAVDAAQVSDGLNARPPQWGAVLDMVAHNQAACKGSPHAALAHAACVASVMLWSRGLKPDEHAQLNADDDAAEVTDRLPPPDTSAVPAQHAACIHAVHGTVRRHVARIGHCVALSHELWCVLSQWVPCDVPRDEVHPATQRVWLVAPRPRPQTRVRKPDVVELAVRAVQQGIDRVVVIMPSAAAFNHHCRQAVRDAQDEHTPGSPPIVFEVIEYAQLCGVKPMHALVPPMSVVPTHAEDDVVRQWSNGSGNAKASLPSMLSSDAMSRWFAWPEDTLVQYTARLGHGTAAFHMVRRVVQENTASSTYSASGERKRASGWFIV